jgi:hypothetical protein
MMVKKVVYRSDIWCVWFKSMRNFFYFFAAAIIAIVCYVPFIGMVCNSGNCVQIDRGYAFVWDLSMFDQIDSVVLLSELAAVLLISGAYYFLVLKNNEKE